MIWEGNCAKKGKKEGKGRSNEEKLISPVGHKLSISIYR